MNDPSYVSIPLMTGKDEDASITLINATFKLGNSPIKKYPDPDFGAWLVDEIYEKKKIFALKKGLFGKNGYRCSSCGSELNIEAPKPMDIEYDLQYKDFPPFQVRITVLGVGCDNCKTICGVEMKGSSIYHLNEAIIRAFESENIKP